MSSRRKVWIELYALSPREHFVCQGLQQGISYKEIAGILDITPDTARATAKDAMRKLGVGDWQALARVYRLAREIAELAPTRVRAGAPNFSRAST